MSDFKNAGHLWKKDNGRPGFSGYINLGLFGKIKVQVLPDQFARDGRLNILVANRDLLFGREEDGRSAGTDQGRKDHAGGAARTAGGGPGWGSRAPAEPVPREGDPDPGDLRGAQTEGEADIPF